MRCPFCHNSSLVVPEWFGAEMPEEEVLGFLKKRVGVLDGVCITGGEPTLHKDLFEFTAKIRDMGYERIKLDTNGTNPEYVKKMIEGGTITYIAMDIKNCKEKYGMTIGIPGFDASPIEKSVEILKGGSVPFELRTTVATGLHTAEDVAKIGKWVGDDKTNYFLQRFKKGDTCIDVDGLDSPEEADMLAMKTAADPYFAKVTIRGL